MNIFAGLNFRGSGVKDLLRGLYFRGPGASYNCYTKPFSAFTNKGERGMLKVNQFFHNAAKFVNGVVGWT